MLELGGMGDVSTVYKRAMLPRIGFWTGADLFVGLFLLFFLIRQYELSSQWPSVRQVWWVVNMNKSNDIKKKRKQLIVIIIMTTMTVFITWFMLTPLSLLSSSLIPFAPTKNYSSLWQLFFFKSNCLVICIVIF